MSLLLIICVIPNVLNILKQHSVFTSYNLIFINGIFFFFVKRYYNISSLFVNIRPIFKLLKILTLTHINNVLQTQSLCDFGFCVVNILEKKI